MNTPRPLATGQGSFLHVDQPDVVLVTWKVAEDGDGTILRYSGGCRQARRITRRFPYFDVKAAWLADALERNQNPPATAHGFRFPVKPFQIVTVRVEGTPDVK